MTLIIAEAGVNHNGSELLAMKLIDAAYDAGADIVKFQTFRAKKMVTNAARQAQYQIQNTQLEETQFSMLSRLELSFDSHQRLLMHCESLGIEFLSTAFDMESLRFLVEDIGVKRLKIPSGEITNGPLVLAHAMSGLDVIVSTGMATLSEVESVLGVLAFGYMGCDEEPSDLAFMKAYASPDGQSIIKEKVTILHCTTEYPAPLEEVNLEAMRSMGLAFRLPIGYSDHTKGIVVPIAAVAMGACIIEKHFTLDRDLEGPDHKASLEPEELKEMISAIRAVEVASGDGVKIPSESEMGNKVVARKSLVASRAIGKGCIFSTDDVDVKRPGSGMSPMRYWDVLGKPASKSYKEGDILSE